MLKKFDACKVLGSNVLQQQNEGVSVSTHKHSDIIMSPDFEGIYTPSNPNEPVWKGARSNRRCPYFWENDSDTIDNPNIIFTDAFDLNANVVQGSFMIRFFGNYTGIDTASAYLMRLQIVPNGTPWHSILIYLHPTTFQVFMRLTEEGSDTSLFINTDDSLPLYEDTKIGFFADGTKFGLLINDIIIVYGEYNGTIQEGSKWIVSSPTNTQAVWAYIWDIELNGKHMPLDEGYGTNIHDIEGNIVGLITTTDINKFWTGRTKDTLGKYKIVGNFEKDGKIVLSDNVFPQNVDFSISGRFTYKDTGVSVYLTGHSTGSASYEGWLIRIQTSYIFTLTMYNGVDGSESINIANTLEELQGENIFLIEFKSLGSDLYDVTVYLNGKQNSKTSILIFPTVNSFPAIGHWAGSSAQGDYVGLIYDFEYRNVRIPINEGSGRDIHDLSGNVVGTLHIDDIDLFWSKRAKQHYESVMKITDYEERLIIDPVLTVSEPVFDFSIKFKLTSLDPGSGNYVRFDIVRLANNQSTGNYISALHVFPNSLFQFTIHYLDGSSTTLTHPISAVEGEEYKIHCWCDGVTMDFYINDVYTSANVKFDTLSESINICTLGSDVVVPDGRASALGTYSDFKFQGVSYPLNEGHGVDIHNNLGEVVGLITTTDINKFWSGKVKYNSEERRPVASFARTTAPYMNISLLNMYNPAVTYLDVECSFICTSIVGWTQQIFRLVVNDTPWRVLGVLINASDGIIKATFANDSDVMLSINGPVVIPGKQYHTKFYAKDGNAIFIVNDVEYTITYEGNINQNGTGQIFLNNPSDDQNFFGSVWNFRIFDIYVPVDEGEGKDIHDIQGNIVGVFNMADHIKYAWRSSILKNKHYASYNDDYNGDLIDPIPTLHYQSEATNINPHSNNLDNWPNSPDTLEILMNQVGLTGEPNTACYIADIKEDAELYASYNLLDVAPLTPAVLKLYIKKQDTATYSTLIYLRKMGDTDENSFVSFNPVSGNCFITQDDSGNTEMQVESYGDFWVIYIYDIPVNTLNDTYRFTIYPVYYDLDTNQPAGIIATGSVVIGNVELYKNKTIADVSSLGPIFTNGEPVTIPRTEYKFHPHNISNDSMAFTARVQADSTGRVIGTFLNRSNDIISVNDKGGIGTGLDYTYEQLNDIGIVVGVSDRYSGRFLSNAYVELPDVHYTEAVFNWTVMYIPEVLADETTSSYFTILRYGTNFYSLMLYVGYGGEYKDNIILAIKNSAEEAISVSFPKVRKGQIYRILASSDGTTLSLTVNGKKSTRALIDNTLFASDDIMTMGRSGGQSAGGILYDTNIEGQYIKIDEGAGDIIHDSLGNPVGTIYAPNLDAFWIKHTYPNYMWLYVNGQEGSAKYTGQLISEYYKVTQPDLAHGDMRGPLYPWRPHYDHTIINNNELGVLYVENGEDGYYGAAFNNDIPTEPGQRYKLQFRPIAQSEENNNGTCYLGTGYSSTLYINAAMTSLGVYDEYQFVSIYEKTRVRLRAGLSTIGAWKKYTDIKLSLVPEMIGGQLIKNNSFFDDSDNWTPVNVDVSFPEPGKVRITNNVDGSYGVLSQGGIPVIAGKTYRFTAYTRVSSKGNAVRSCYHIGDDTDTLKYFQNVKANDNIATNLIITPDMDDIKVSLLVGSNILDNYADFQCVSLVEIPYRGEKILNNIFEDGETDWTLGEGWEISDFRAKCDGTQIDVSRLTQSISLTAGTKYRIFVNMVFHETGSVAVEVGGVLSPYRSSDTSYTFDVIAGNTGKFSLVASNNFIGQIDSVFMTEVDWEEEDISEPLEIGIDHQGAIEVADMEVVINDDFEVLKQLVRDKFA